MKRFIATAGLPPPLTRAYPSGLRGRIQGPLLQSFAGSNPVARTPAVERTRSRGTKEEPHANPRAGKDSGRPTPQRGGRVEGHFLPFFMIFIQPPDSKTASP